MQRGDLNEIVTNDHSTATYKSLKKLEINSSWQQINNHNGVVQLIWLTNQQYKAMIA